MKKAIARPLDTLDYSSTEALNSICSNLAFTGKRTRKIVMTSYESGEGKSLLTFQIACNMAKRGKRIVIVDADLRRSTMINKMGLETSGEWLGLAHYLSDQCSFDDILYSTNLSNIYVIPSGRVLKNPVTLIDSDEFRALLDKLADVFDIVLIDAPPVGLVIDAAEIAKACDGTIIVVKYNSTRRRDLNEIIKQIAKTNCQILGCIINMVKFEGMAEKKYYNRTYNTSYNTQSPKSQKTTH